VLEFYSSLADTRTVMTSEDGVATPILPTMIPLSVMSIAGGFLVTKEDFYCPI